jgi:hypothetical protein
MTATTGDNFREAFLAHNSGELLSIGIASYFVILPLGLASGRFLLRALPPAMSDHRGGGRSGAVALYAAAFIGLYIFSVLLISVLSFLDESTAKTIQEKSVVLVETVVLSLAIAVLWASAAVGLLLRRHRRPRDFLDQPFVLFLRRFSSFADRAVVALILRQAAYNVPVVFLTPTLSRPGDWDLFLVGFAGFKFLHPWRSAPIVIQVHDDAWQEAADELTRRAQTILLDASETSGALRAEAEMVDRAGRWSDTVCLRPMVPGKDPVGGFSGVRAIDYTKSWVRALPRMAMGLLLVLFAAAFVFASVAALLSPILGTLSPILATLVIAVAVPAYYYSGFVRPTINREAKVALKAALPVGPVDAPQGIGGWLILPVIGLVITPIWHGYVLLSQLWLIFRDGGWARLTTPGTTVYHYLWGPWITFAIIEELAFIVLAIATLVLLFRKSKKTRNFAIALWSISVVCSVLDYLLGNLIPAVAEQSNAMGLIWVIVGAATWIPYFIFSRRVKTTFVR